MKTAPFNAADYLDSREAVEAFLLEFAKLDAENVRLRGLLVRYQIANYIPEDCDLYRETQAVLNQQQTEEK